MTMTRNERIEELQRLLNDCLNNNEMQEAYWIECELDELYEEQQQGYQYLCDWEEYLGVDE